MATGEVCVASATCLQSFDLKRGLAVLRVGQGAGAAQSFIDTSGNNRKIIWDGFGAGTPPATILAQLAAADGAHQTRQYGIVDLPNAPVTFTGALAGAAKAGTAGTSGTIRFAIQGNVLTGQIVVAEARKAFLNTNGDLSQRVMAGMEAARAFGGDGRCSCSGTMPTSCGAPPPAPFKSAHVAFIALARMGDVDGVCNVSQGCANGSYYLDLEFLGDASAPDPVHRLQAAYNLWRANLAGHPDHIRSSASAGADALPADGQTQTKVTVELRDVDGVSLAAGGASVSVTRQGGGTPFATPGPVADLGNGTYEFTLTAGTQPGTDVFEILVDDGTVQALLYPFLELRVDPAAILHAGHDEVSSAAGADGPFTLDFGPARAGEPYLLLASAAGTVPGQTFGSQTLPLNLDPLFLYTLLAPGPPFLPGSLGVLDAAGRASASLVAPAGALAPLVGLHTDWAAAALGSPAAPSNAVGLDVGP